MFEVLDKLTGTAVLGCNEDVSEKWLIDDCCKVLNDGVDFVKDLFSVRIMRGWRQIVTWDDNAGATGSRGRVDTFKECAIGKCEIEVDDGTERVQSLLRKH